MNIRDEELKEKQQERKKEETIEISRGVVSTTSAHAKEAKSWKCVQFFVLGCMSRV